VTSAPTRVKPIQIAVALLLGILGGTLVGVLLIPRLLGSAPRPLSGAQRCAGLPDPLCQLPRGEPGGPAELAPAAAERSDARAAPRCERPHLASQRRIIVHDGQTRRSGHFPAGVPQRYAGLRRPVDRSGDLGGAGVHQEYLAARDPATAATWAPLIGACCCTPVWPAAAPAARARTTGGAHRRVGCG
jgi:hypothetical protein